MNDPRMKKDRREALLSMDRRVLEMYWFACGLEIPRDPALFWYAVHKSRVECPDIPRTEKETSRDWLRRFEDIIERMEREAPMIYNPDTEVADDPAAASALRALVEECRPADTGSAGGRDRAGEEEQPPAP